MNQLTSPRPMTDEEAWLEIYAAADQLYQQYYDLAMTQALSSQDQSVVIREIHRDYDVPLTLVCP